MQKAKVKFNKSGSKYLKTIHGLLPAGVFMGTQVDVYAVLEAFKVTCPARQHAVKKLLCAGLRGKGSALKDLIEAVDAVERAVQLEKIRGGEE